MGDFVFEYIIPAKNIAISGDDVIRKPDDSDSDSNNVVVVVLTPKHDNVKLRNFVYVHPVQNEIISLLVHIVVIFWTWFTF